jgi:hypothetical protein
MKKFWLMLIALLVLYYAPMALAKGEVLTRITISGPGLKSTIEITDPNSLNALGSFDLLYDWGRPNAPHVGTGFEVTRFYAVGDGGPTSDRFRYYPMPSGRPGYIYLLDNEDSPAPGQHWYYASVRGDATLQRLLKQAGAQLPTVAEGSTWDAISVDSLPTQINAREDVTLGFTVRPNAEMLRVPKELLVYTRLPENDWANVFMARADGKANHYSVKLQFPSAGQWYWTVGSSTDIGQQLMPALTVIDNEVTNQPASNAASSVPVISPQAATTATAAANDDASSFALAFAAGFIGIIGIGGGFYFWRKQRR